MNNADRIRAMTDDELAEWFKYDCPIDSIAGCTYTDESTDDCKKCWLEWLKREVEE